MRKVLGDICAALASILALGSYIAIVLIGTEKISIDYGGWAVCFMFAFPFLLVVEMILNGSSKEKVFFRCPKCHAYYPISKMQGLRCLNCNKTDESTP